MSTEFQTEELTESNGTFNEFIKFARDLIVILIIVILIRIFLITPFKINGSSMEDSYHDKEYILVDKLSYLNFVDTFGTKSGTTTIEKGINNLLGSIPLKVGDPIRGDVVVITPHADKNREYYIKRIIGLPGDTIRIEGGNVYIKISTASGFTQIHEPYLSLTNSGKTDLGEITDEKQFLLGEGQYWVMGDNRRNSSDSRSCFRGQGGCIGREYTAHFIKRADIIGKALLDFGYFHIFIDKTWQIDTKNIGWVNTPRFLNHPRNATYPELESKSE